MTKFKNKKIIAANNQNLHEVDLSKNSKAKRIFLNNNYLSQIDVSACRNLEELHIYNNPIKLIKIRKGKRPPLICIKPTQEIEFKEIKVNIFKDIVNFFKK